MATVELPHLPEHVPFTIKKQAVLCKVKLKFTLEQATKAQMGRKAIIVLFL